LLLCICLIIVGLAVLAPLRFRGLHNCQSPGTVRPALNAAPVPYAILDRQPRRRLICAVGGVELVRGIERDTPTRFSDGSLSLCDSLCIDMIMALPRHLRRKVFLFHQPKRRCPLAALLSAVELCPSFVSRIDPGPRSRRSHKQRVARTVT